MSTSGSVAVVVIGDELLDGRTRDKNAHFLTKWCSDRGCSVGMFVGVGDDPGAVEHALRDLIGRFDVVITSGGLGPTDDDRTRVALASVAGRPLATDAAALDRLRAKYAARGASLSPGSARQAMVPAGAEVIPSAVGTADPFITRIGGRAVVSLPGVPRELEALAPLVLARVLPERRPEHVRAFRLIGCRESVAGDLIEEWGPPPGVRITYSAESPYVVVRAVGASADLVDRAGDELARLLADWALPDDGPALEDLVVGTLAQRGWRIALAESCTGGRVTSMIVGVPGASAVLERAWVTYSNTSKHEELGVGVGVLQREGAVSAPVARALAVGARCRAGVEVGLGVTGIAGPDGGTAAKPVGTVYLAVATPDLSVVAKAQLGGRSREEFRVATSHLGLRMIHVACLRTARVLEAFAGVVSVESQPKS